MAERGLDAGTMVGDGAGQLDEGRQAAAPGPDQPVIQQAQSPPGLAEAEDLPELLFEASLLYSRS